MKPFQKPSDQILRYNSWTVLRMAEAIQKEKDFKLGLPALADALEEAGCTDTELLCHCRSDIEHHDEYCLATNAILDIKSPTQIYPCGVNGVMVVDYDQPSIDVI